MLSIVIHCYVVTGVSAHVSVTPNKVGIASSQDFTVNFGIEKDIPTTEIRLVIPEGVENVSPYIKPGWKIDVKKSGHGEEAKITEITWKDGSVQPGFRETFQFKAQVPPEEGTVKWKAYQTYADGSVQTWDQEPMTGMSDKQNEEMEKTGKGPYSETKIINDLRLKPEKKEKNDATSITLSIVALVLSIVTFTRQQIRNKA